MALAELQRVSVMTSNSGSPFAQQRASDLNLVSSSPLNLVARQEGSVNQSLTVGAPTTAKYRFVPLLPQVSHSNSKKAIVMRIPSTSFVRTPSLTPARRTVFDVVKPNPPPSITASATQISELPSQEAVTTVTLESLPEKRQKTTGENPFIPAEAQTGTSLPIAKRSSPAAEANEIKVNNYEKDARISVDSTVEMTDVVTADDVLQQQQLQQQQEVIQDTHAVMTDMNKSLEQENTPMMVVRNVIHIEEDLITNSRMIFPHLLRQKKEEAKTTDDGKDEEIETIDDDEEEMESGTVNLITDSESSETDNNNKTTSKQHAQSITQMQTTPTSASVHQIAAQLATTNGSGLIPFTATTAPAPPVSLPHLLTPPTPSVSNVMTTITAGLAPTVTPSAPIQAPKLIPDSVIGEKPRSVQASAQRTTMVTQKVVRKTDATVARPPKASRVSLWEMHCIVLGEAYKRLLGTDGYVQDIPTGLRMLQQAVDQRSPVALYCMGTALLRGMYFCRIDAARGSIMIQLAIKRGVTTKYIVSHKLGFDCGLLGYDLVHPQSHHSLKQLMKSATQGHQCAQFTLAQCYECGRTDGEVDMCAAMDWYHRSAAQGFAPAMWRLAEHYQSPSVPRPCLPLTPSEERLERELFQDEARGYMTAAVKQGLNKELYQSYWKRLV